MNVLIDQLAKSVLQKDTLEQCTIAELQELTNEYPYFSAAQLLLAKKLLLESNGNFENRELYGQQLQKTSVFFYNPLWLEYLLNDTGSAEIIPAKTFEPTFTTDINEEPVPEKKETEQANTNDIISEPAVLLLEKEPELMSEQSEIKTEPVEVSNQQEPDLSVELPAFKIEPVDPDKTEFIFEPYHTVDYFASQGIKFKEDEQPKDKFGLQLKSFTEWLKTLKRLPVSEIIPAVDANAEQKVEQLAGQSLQDREVITETMAEVWEKQGNTIKAIDIYSKLSLLDPSKRAYFAAKIEDLKKIN